MDRRKIGYIEAMGLHFGEQNGAMAHLVALFSIDGLIEPEGMIDAAELLFMRHPLLRSLLVKEAENIFIETKTSFSDVTIEFIHKKITKEEMVEREIKRKLDETKALWRLTIALDPKKKNPTHLIAFSCHLAICDASSSFCLVRELVRVYEKLDQGVKISEKSLPFLDGIEEFFPTHPTLDLYFDHLKTVKGQEIKEKDKNEKELATSKVVLADLKIDHLEAIHKFARLHKISPHALLVAAYIFSLHRLFKKQSNITIYTPIDMRSKAIPAIDQSHFGRFVSYVFNHIKIDLNQMNLFDFALFYQEELEKEVSQQAFPPLVDGISTQQLFNRIKQVIPTSMSDTLFLGHLGKLPFSREFGAHHRMTSCYFAKNLIVGDFPVIYHVATLDEGMHLCMVYNEAVLSHVEAEKLMMGFIQELEKTCGFNYKASIEERKAS